MLRKFSVRGGEWAGLLHLHGLTTTFYLALSCLGDQDLCATDFTTIPLAQLIRHSSPLALQDHGLATTLKGAFTGPGDYQLSAAFRAVVPFA